MNQATQRSEQKHRQPGKPELAAGTRETPQRCCNLGGKLGLLEQGPTAAHPSQDSQAWSAETQGAARKAQSPTGKQAQGWSLRPPVALKTQSEPIVGHTTATSQAMHQRRQNKANASMHHTNGNTRHHWITKTNSTWIITNTATHYTVRVKAMVRAPVWGSALTVAITPPKHHSCSKTSVASSGLRPRNQEAGTPASQRMSCNVRRQSFSTCCRSTATKRR